MTISVFEFLVVGLAVFRITHLFVYDSIARPLRSLFVKEIKLENDEEGDEWRYESRGKGVRKFIGDLISCHWCFSVWAAFAVLLGINYFPVVAMWAVYIFAFAAVAAILEEFVLKFFT